MFCLVKVYIKVAFIHNDFKMAGGQTIYTYKDDNSSQQFRQVIISRINTLLSRYGYKAESINHIIITFIPVNYNLISKFKVNSKDILVSQFLKR